MKQSYFKIIGLRFSLQLSLYNQGLRVCAKITSQFLGPAILRSVPPLKKRIFHFRPSLSAPQSQYPRSKTPIPACPVQCEAYFSGAGSLNQSRQIRSKFNHQFCPAQARLFLRTPLSKKSGERLNTGSLL